MIPYDDRGLTLGDGLFETILSRDGEPVLWDAHIARLAAASRALGLPPPDGGEARALCKQAAGTGRMAVRLTLTAGSGGRGLDRPAAPVIRLFATSAPAPRPQAPAALITSAVRRNEGSPASRLKTLSYLDSVMARQEARAVGADEALMLNNRDEVTCAGAANVFWVARGRLFTPALECGALDGIMRAQVLARVGAREVRVARAALEEAEAVFLTNSLIGVRAVDRLDGRELSVEPVRPIARAVADLA